MKKLVFTLLFVLLGQFAAFAEVELTLGGGYGSDGGFFHMQFGWKQLYNVPIIVTADWDVKLTDSPDSTNSFSNVDLNTSIYDKRWALGLGVGYQWYNGYGVDNKTERWYIKPNISYNFKYMKFSVGSHFYFDEEPDVYVAIGFRDMAAIIAMAFLSADGGDIGSGKNPKFTDWGDINLKGGAY